MLNNASYTTGYRIEFEENTYKPGVWNKLKDIDGNVTNTTEFLWPGVNYKFRIKAKNRNGWSKNSSEETQRFSSKGEGIEK